MRIFQDLTCSRLGTAALVWLAWLLCACQIDIASIPLAQDASELDGAVVKDASSDLPRDAADDDGAEDGASAPRHPSCAEDLPSPLPELPKVDTLANGRPEFDLWRELSCASVETQPTCADYADSAPHLCQRCVGARVDDPLTGVCVPFGTRGCIATGHAQGCVACVPPLVKARACCLELDVDCRPWPFSGSSRAGELCANHDDCEPGLVCASAGADETRFAVCACPETRGEQSVSINLCLPERAP